MKTLIRIFAVIIFMNISGLLTNNVTAQNMDVNFQVFYDQLSPYGVWVDYPNYGYAWIPDVDHGFFPYATEGQWVLTEFGWTWVSAYPWGWAPFHYGRWLYDPMYGWIWVPGRVWGPAWVSWRSCDGYYGWTPLAPGFNINITVINNYYAPTDQWIFIRDRDFCRHNLADYYIDRRENHNFIQRTRTITNTHVDRNTRVTYLAGPDRDEVQRSTGRVIKPVAIREETKPAERLNGDNLSIYKPAIRKSPEAGSRVAPKRVDKLKDVIPIAERKPFPPKRNSTPSPVNTRTGSNVQTTKTATPIEQRNGQQGKVVPQKDQQNQQPSKREGKISPQDGQRTDKQPLTVNPSLNTQNNQGQHTVASEKTKGQQPPQKQNAPENKGKTDRQSNPDPPKKTTTDKAPNRR
ncbi:MAG: hypothetical protein NTX61_18210 [Bacteroidetes bacterium]|nr:hypothetical protein [Bacteroidota bacterium]